jgi:TonB family protein
MENEVKYCDSCQEDFARKFSFCPNCGAKLSKAEKLPAADPLFKAAAAASNPRKARIEAGYGITIVEEKNVKQRNLLLLGAVLLMTMLITGGVIYSIFNKALELGAVETDDPFAFVAEVDPVTMDPAEELKQDKKKTGGGGGGRGDKDPAQKGKDATQVDNPLFSPSKDYVQMTNPELKIRAATQGTKKAPVTSDPYGLVKGGLIPSDGQGCCGGQGNGRQTGQGNDDGKGLGPGKYGGDGGGGENLDGGKNDPDKDIPKVKTGVSEALKIISKPRANYTDLARQNLVQGKVVLRVTFLASGGIGTISVVSGLPSGLTEQAIAAARSIKFEPAKVNGSAVAITKTIEYTFSIF